MNLPVIVWLILSIIWGTTWLFIKLGLEGLPPFSFAGIRFVIALIPLVLLFIVRKPKVPASRADWRLIAITGLLTFSLNYGLVFWGENFISSGLTAIFYSTFPLFGLAIAHFYLPSEQMTVSKTTGVLLGIAGVVVIFFNEIRLADASAAKGSAAIILASLGTAYAGILIKSRGKHIDPLVLTIGQMAVGVLPLLVLGFWYEGNPLAFNWTARAWVALVYLALVGSALAFVLVYWLMQRMDVTKTQLIPLASTLIAVILGWLVLQEELNWKTLVGGFFILFGLAVTVLGGRRRRKQIILHEPNSNS